MKFIPAQLMVLMGEKELRRNLRPLLSAVGLLAATVALFSVIFHWIMLQEGQQHSWITGVYWTLTVMSTLGFGDITFHSDAGRFFSIVVLLTGIVLLLIVLPFAFIRFFYAPWLEAQMRARAPRSLDDTEKGHVILCSYDSVAAELVPQFRRAGIPYCVIEPDPAVAAQLVDDGIRVIIGEPTDSNTYAAVQAHAANLVFANHGDATNSNITLAVREVSANVPVLATVDENNAIDILELSGATQVVPVKRQLGEHLAGRVTAGTPKTNRVGRFEDLIIGEFPIEHTTLGGRSVRDTHLRNLTGANIVAVWERGKLLPAGPDTMLTPHSVPVVVGTEEQILEIDALFSIYHPNDNPVLIIGGGKVGAAAAHALHARDIRVTVLDKSTAIDPQLRAIADRVVVGDAADLNVVMGAGLGDASSVVLTTNDDATNIFLAVYCRRLNPDVRIVSRINEAWNLEAIHRAGANFALSHVSLATKSVLAAARGQDIVVLGEGAEVFVERVPAALAGKTLAESQIGADIGLNVIAIRTNAVSLTNPRADAVMETESELVMLGTEAQYERFVERFL